MNKRFAARLSHLTDLPTLQSVKGLVPLASLKRQRLRISFDIDDTLACQALHSDAEPSRLPEFVHRWLGEPLRIGTRSLIRELRRRNCSVWIYTSSGRTPAYIRRWLMLHGIHVDGVVNSVRHKHALTERGLSHAPSKLPSAFDIDLHVDDSEGVQIEGLYHGFRVVVVRPDDQQWAQQVLGAVAQVQRQMSRQQQAVRRAKVVQDAPVYSS